MNEQLILPGIATVSITEASFQKKQQQKQALKKKILIGAYFLGEERHLKYHHLIQRIMDSYLENRKDRALFDLPPIHKDTK